MPGAVAEEFKKAIEEGVVRPMLDRKKEELRKAEEELQKSRELLERTLTRYGLWQ